MTTLLEQGKDHTFSVTFVKQDGSEATLIAGPTIEIRRTLSTGSVVDLVASDMLHVTGSTYAYILHVPEGKRLGDYFAIYRATYDDGTDVVYNDNFTICTKDFFQRIKGAGLYKTSVSGPSEKTIKSLRDEITALQTMLTEIQSKIELGTVSIHKEIGDKIEENRNETANNLVALSVLKNDVNQFREYIKNLTDRVEEMKTGVGDVTKELSEVKPLVEKVYVKSLTDEELEQVANNGR